MKLHPERLPGARRLALLTAKIERTKAETSEKNLQLSLDNRCHVATFNESATGSPNRTCCNVEKRHPRINDICRLRGSDEHSWIKILSYDVVTDRYVVGRLYDRNSDFTLSTVQITMTWIREADWEFYDDKTSS